MTCSKEMKDTTQTTFQTNGESKIKDVEISYKDGVPGCPLQSTGFAPLQGSECRRRLWMQMPHSRTPPQLDRADEPESYVHMYVHAVRRCEMCCHQSAILLVVVTVCRRLSAIRNVQAQRSFAFVTGLGFAQLVVLCRGFLFFVIDGLFPGKSGF